MFATVSDRLGRMRFMFDNSIRFTYILLLSALVTNERQREDLDYYSISSSNGCSLKLFSIANLLTFSEYLLV